MLTENLGREIFLRQLAQMCESRQAVDWMDEPEAVESFDVPADLREVFTAYYLEFVDNHGEVTNIDGAFFDNEDVKRGISNKLRAFYGPMADMLGNEYELDVSVVISPDYEDSSTVVVIADNHCGRNDLPVPVVLAVERVKAWRPFFSSNKPEDVYAELRGVYWEMEGRLLTALVFSSRDCECGFRPEITC
ncbi:MAG: hypothetical protein K6T65_05420 [Peptococcaceae bacterium]|nr:hypothetical protein [Peptococcaceae bacterium]